MITIQMNTPTITEIMMTTNKYLFLLVLLFLLFLLLGLGCKEYPEPYNKLLPDEIIVDTLVDEYEVRYGKGDECRDFLLAVIYIDTGEEVPGIGVISDDISYGTSICIKDKSYMWINPSLSPAQTNLIKLHEFIHNLLYCLEIDDIEHGTKDTWCAQGYGCFVTPKDDKDSLEYAVAYTVYYWEEKK